MTHEQNLTQEVIILPETKRIIDADIAALKMYGEAHALRGLEGRVKAGLDPSGMLAVPDSRIRAMKVAERLGTSIDAVEHFITELHTSGPWRNIEKLKNGGTAPEAHFYLSLAGVCNEDMGDGYTPDQYVKDRERVMNELDILGGDDRVIADALFDVHLKERIYGLRDKEVTVVNGVEIVIASGDPFIGIAAEGYAGGINKTGKDEDPGTMYFVGTESIDPASIESIGLITAFAEVYDATTGSMERVEVDSEKSKNGRVVFAERSELSQSLSERTGRLKRIAGGFYLAYHDKELAKTLLSTELQRRHEAEA